ncbi:MAG TPA: DUF4349 domain-containing protein [Candidatus Nanoarchaeia archaeon]|nr:DUF4349 domain-containing protein [Candidatus Nanoarchaeia archaeon]
MTFNDQLKRLKENWLFLLLFLVVVLFLSAGNLLSGMFGSSYSGDSGAYAKSYGGYANEIMAADSLSYGMPIYGDQGFAPEVTDRKLTKTSSLSTEVKRGSFPEADEKLKGIVSSTGSFILNENVNSYGVDDTYMVGYYEIKVDSKKYDAVILQLKSLGKVQSFNENTQDITGYYKDLNTDLEAERSRLLRFKEMLDKAETVEQQIQLADRIFDIERTISYYEESLKAADNRVDYSTVSLTIQEKQSDYADVVVVKLSQLTRTIVESFNALVSLLFLILPWAVVAVVVWFVVKKVRSR